MMDYPSSPAVALPQALVAERPIALPPDCKGMDRAMANAQVSDRNREMNSRHLAEAELHIAQGVRHIAEQEDRIKNLARHNQDTTEARKLLDNFYASQALHIQHRDRILKQLQ